MRGAASGVCILAGMGVLSCAEPPRPLLEPFWPERPPAPFERFSAPAPSETEQLCAWFGGERDGVLYFGQSAFWSEFHRSKGDPEADLESAGPQQVGRFDLAARRMLPALDLGAPDERSGTWDVLPHPNGRVYFTSLFGTSGWVDPTSGSVVHFPDAGAGLNELELGPGGTLFASRYAGGPERPGSVVVLAEDGRVLGELELAAPEGFALQPKTVAFDAARGRLWITTDRLRLDPASGDDGQAGLEPEHHPTIVVDLAGAEQGRVDDVEIQFARFAPDGTGFFAVARGPRLELAVLPAGAAGGDLSQAHFHVVESAYPRTYDFVQDLQLAADGRVIATRWSGVVHLLARDGTHTRIDFPELAPFGLYYTAVLENGHVCATYCEDVSVVCAPLPDPPPDPAPASLR